MSSSTGEQAWHLPVLLEETVSSWYHDKGRTYVDGTVGGGGHTGHLLSRCPESTVLGIDRDLESLERASQTLDLYQDRVSLQRGSFADLDSHLSAAGFPSQVDGILLDLGVNSHQLDAAERGFSFLHDGPLDMRFQPDSSQQTAADLVNQLPEQELVQIFREWGEEPQAKRAARAIVTWRQEQPFHRTGQLRDCLHQSLKFNPRKKTDPATLIFQALRIAVNREFDHIDRFLEEFPKWLAPGGRIAIISFHSLEDRRVKKALRKHAKGCVCPPDFPVCACGIQPTLRLRTSKPIRPSEEELEANNRARSARLRVAEKLPAPQSNA